MRVGRGEMGINQTLSASRVNLPTARTSPALTSALWHSGERREGTLTDDYDYAKPDKRL